MKINFKDIASRFIPDPKQPSDFGGAAGMIASYAGWSEGSIDGTQALIYGIISLALYLLREHNTEEVEKIAARAVVVPPPTKPKDGGG